MNITPLTLYIAALAFALPTILFVIKEFPTSTKWQNFLYLLVILSIGSFFWWATAQGGLTL